MKRTYETSMLCGGVHVVPGRSTTSGASDTVDMKAKINKRNPWRHVIIFFSCMVVY